MAIFSEVFEKRMRQREAPPVKGNFVLRALHELTAMAYAMYSCVPDMYLGM